LNEGIKEGYPFRNSYFTTIGSSSVKTVADRVKYDSIGPAVIITSTADELSCGTNIDDLERH